MQQVMAENTANKYDSGFEDEAEKQDEIKTKRPFGPKSTQEAVSYTHLRAHET